MAPPIQWTEQRIAQGLEQFFKENGHYPSSQEFDKCPYLPTSRQIQRKFPGGLPALRTRFIPNAPADHTKGLIRSEIARKNIQRSYQYEEEFYNFLISLFPEKLVHEQKRLRPGNIACDFYVYLSESSGIAIDLFYSGDIRNITGIVNIKLKRYIGLPQTQKIYFVLIANPAITQKDIDRVVQNRKISLPENIAIKEEGSFKEELIKLIRPA